MAGQKVMVFGNMIRTELERKMPCDEECSIIK